MAEGDETKMGFADCQAFINDLGAIRYDFRMALERHWGLANGIAKVREARQAADNALAELSCLLILLRLAHEEGKRDAKV